MPARRSIVAKIFYGIRQLRERKLLAAETIRHSDLPLARGIWFVGGSFSVRAGAKLVSPLSGVKRWFGFRTGPVMRKLVTLAGLIVPPWYAWRSTDGTGNADILLLSRTQEAVAFDVKNAVVVRYKTPEAAALLIEAVDKLRSTHNCPKLEYDSQRRLLVEGFASGTAFGAAPYERQLGCVNAILAQAAASPRKELSIETRERWINTFDYLRSKSRIREESTIPAHVSEFVKSAAACTIHGDLSGENVILSRDTHVVIDFDCISTGPAFFDILDLFMAEAGWRRPQLLNALMQGTFDAGLSELGIVLDRTSTRDRRLATCCAAVSWKFLSGMMTETKALDLMNQIVGPAAVEVPPNAPRVGQSGME